MNLDFEPRCEYAQYVPAGKCSKVNPETTEKASDHSTRCHLSAEQIYEVAASAAQGSG